VGQTRVRKPLNCTVAPEIDATVRQMAERARMPVSRMAEKLLLRALSLPSELPAAPDAIGRAADMALRIGLGLKTDPGNAVQSQENR
jgi:hypothetical protein